MKKHFIYIIGIFVCLLITACTSDKYALQNTYISTIDNFYNSMILEEDTSYMYNKKNTSINYADFKNRISENSIYLNTAMSFHSSIYNSDKYDKKTAFKGRDVLLNALSTKNSFYNSMTNIENTLSNDFVNTFIDTLSSNYTQRQPGTVKQIKQASSQNELAEEYYYQFVSEYGKYKKEHPLQDARVKLMGEDLKCFMFIQNNTLDKVTGTINYIENASDEDLKYIYRTQSDITNISMINIKNVMNTQSKNTSEYKALDYLYQANKKANEAFKLSLNDISGNSTANTDKIRTLGTETGILITKYQNEFNKINFNK